MFVCKVCGNEVKAGLAFCPVCGADVVDNYEVVCPVCNSKNNAGSKYCAKCGGILTSLRKPTCEVCGAQNLPGAQFCVKCGSPIRPDVDTHSDADMIDLRKAKRRLDNMERERMAAVDKEITLKRQKTAEERELAMQEVDSYRQESEKEYQKKAGDLEKYREKLNELGGEDVDLLKKMSIALGDYSKYYADPYSQIDEDEINEDVYVCPACGTINPITAVKCSHCGRNKARALLLLAKGKIKQSPPIKRKKNVIEAPKADLEKIHVPTLNEYLDEINREPVDEPANNDVKQEKEEPADFAGPRNGYNPQATPYGQNMYPGYPYPYPPYPYPYPYPQCACQNGCCNKAQSQQGAPQPKESEPTVQKVEIQTSFAHNPNQPIMPYQMPPIVQPVAFVPYVTQEQPLVQYSPAPAQPDRTVRKARPNR